MVVLFEGDYFAIEELFELFTGIISLQRRVIVLLLLYYEMRVSEVSALKMTSIEVERNGKPIKIRIKGKGNKERMIPLP